MLQQQVESSKKWSERDGIIYLTVTSDGTTGQEWIKRLEEKGSQLTDEVKSLLCSIYFNPTSGVTTEIAILPGKRFEDKERNRSWIETVAFGLHKFTRPNAEVACYIREIFTNEELEQMELKYILTMHEPLFDSISDPFFLISFPHDGVSGLGSDYAVDVMGHEYDVHTGFAFAVSQK